jgi:hypothetical protein
MSKNQNTTYLVKNRSAGMVCYRIPEEGIRREFQPGETKRISAGELEKLTYQSGGRTLLENFLQVAHEKAIADLNLRTEEEYFMSEDQVKDLILNGSIEQFLDALDFAPLGVMDLIKSYATSLPMDDIKKREALKNKTGFDVTKALELMRQEKMVDEQGKSENTSTTSTSRRRTTTNYKVVEKTENKEEEKTE